MKIKAAIILMISLFCMSGFSKEEAKKETKTEAKKTCSDPQKAAENFFGKCVDTFIGAKQADGLLTGRKPSSISLKLTAQTWCQCISRNFSVENIADAKCEVHPVWVKDIYMKPTKSMKYKCGNPH